MSNPYRVLPWCLYWLVLAGSVCLASPSLEQVREAAAATYVHGMTDEIALREVGVEGIPHLLTILQDPTFDRRDNVVAMLAHLADNDATTPLLRHLQSPPSDLASPSEDRAMLLVPHALGRIAARDGGEALALLMEKPGPGGIDRLLGPAGSAPAIADLREDLAEQAVRGLALSNAVPARVRLESLVDAGPAGDDEDLPTTRVADTASRGHGASLSFANHVSVSSKMTDSRADSILSFATRKSGLSDFTDDVACCISVQRSGTGQLFGSAGDGLDIIDNNTELTTVLNNGVARVKVVRVINYCSGPGTNIIGCSYSPGAGMSVVRLSSTSEGLLWLHEYGHNVGISSHNPGSNYVMHAGLTSGAIGLSQSECNKFHSPSSSAGIGLVDIGVCHDDDDDDYASTIDNCPDAFNPDQTDTNGDGIGDLCEICEDQDGDGFGAPPSALCAGGLALDCEDTRAEDYPGALEFCDGRDNDCDGLRDETDCSDFEVNGDGRVDGVELVWIGRAFGDCSSNPLSEWWGPVDYNLDGCVDGDDLALLPTAWGCLGTAPVCN